MSYIVEPYQQKMLNDIKKKQTKKKVAASSLVPRKQPKQKRKIAKKKAAKQEYMYTGYVKRKLCITPVDLATLVLETHNFMKYGGREVSEASKLAAKRLNISELFATFVGYAIVGDVGNVLLFTGKKPGRNKIKNSA